MPACGVISSVKRPAHSQHSLKYMPAHGAISRHIHKNMPVAGSLGQLAGRTIRTESVFLTREATRWHRHGDREATKHGRGGSGCASMGVEFGKAHPARTRCRLATAAECPDHKERNRTIGNALTPSVAGVGGGVAGEAAQKRRSL